MSIEERVINLEEFAADVHEQTRILTEIIRRYDERTTGFEKHFKILTELAVRADERMDRS